MRLPLAAAIFPLALTGCALSTTATSTPETAIGIQGRVHGGQQPIVGAHVYLFAAGTTAYAGPGIAPSSSNPSVSLLKASATGNSDSIGAYVLTAADGSFSITNDYTCSAGQQVYLYALGGNPGAGTNTTSGLMAILGDCPISGSFASTSPFVWINEVTTVAAAYAFAGFATDATHVAYSGSPRGRIGIKNAFANAANLADISTGTARASTPVGYGTAPQATVNTLANILASCVNTNGALQTQLPHTPCTTVLSTTGTATDTASAAINIAHNPGNGVALLFVVQTPAAPFAPALTSQPADFTVAIQFSAYSGSGCSAVAVDSTGNVWLSDISLPIVNELAPNGAILSNQPALQYNGGYLLDFYPTALAIDTNDNVYSAGAVGGIGRIAMISSPPVTVTSQNIPILSDYSSVANPLAIDGFSNAWVATSYGAEIIVTGGNKSTTTITTDSQLTFGQAFDSSNNLWLTQPNAHSLAEIVFNGSITATPTVAAVSNVSINSPSGVAIDTAGNKWVANSDLSGRATGSVAKVSLTQIANLSFYTAQTYTGSAIPSPWGIAIDGAQNVWVLNYPNLLTQVGSIAQLSNAGTVLSPPAGYSTPNGAYNFTLDASGNIWTANVNGQCATQFVGLATPVITPISNGVAFGLPFIGAANTNVAIRP